MATQQLLSRRKIGSRESLCKAKAWKDEEIAAVVAVKDGLLDQLTAEKALVAQFSRQAQEEDSRLRVLAKEVTRLRGDIANEEERLVRLKAAEECKSSLVEQHSEIKALHAELETKRKQRIELTERWSDTGTDALTSLHAERDILISTIGESAYSNNRGIAEATVRLETAIQDLKMQHQEISLRNAL